MLSASAPSRDQLRKLLPGPSATIRLPLAATATSGPPWGVRAAPQACARSCVITPSPSEPSAATVSPSADKATRPRFPHLAQEFALRLLVDGTAHARGSSSSSVAVSSDGKLILSGSYDTTARIWDASSGKELRKLAGHSKAVTSVAFSADGKLAATSSEDRTARLTILIDPRKKELFERLCAEEDATPSQVVRRLLRRYIEERTGKPWVPDEETRSTARRRSSGR